MIREMAQASASKAAVVKIGGAIAEDEAAMAALWAGVQQLREEAPLVLVHGGGSQATAVARRLGHEPRIIQGRRVTTDLDLDIVKWTMRGALNVQLVAEGQRRGLQAVGLSGVDGGLLRVTKRPPWQIDGEAIDFGWVGDVERIEPDVLEMLLEAGFLPIVAPLGVDGEGHIYNVNADTVACALAGALRAEKLLLVTDTGGLRRDPGDPESLLSRCDVATYEAGLAEGWIQGGMRVKLHVAFEALNAGVAEVFMLAPDDLAARRRATQVVADWRKAEG